MRRQRSAGANLIGEPHPLGGTATKTVLITGAGGLIGRILRQRLGDRYELRLLTRERIDDPSHIADIVDLAAIQPAFAGVDSVVHLAAAANVRARWEDVLRTNLIGTRNVFEAARREGVGQVVFASSNHVIGMYEVDGAPEVYELADGRVYDETVAPRPDSLYGVSKGFGELLGRYYSDRHGLRVICLRIGGVTEDDRPPPGVPLEVDPARLDEDERRLRSRAIWLSHRDCAQLLRRAIDADGVRWAIAYGTSNNPRQMWDLTSARTLLGYEPEDSAPI